MATDFWTIRPEYVPKETLDAWAKKDPVLRFQKFLKTRGLWDEKKEEQWTKDAMDSVMAAAKEAEHTEGPGLETIFSDVYAELPAHIRAQGEAAFDLARRKGSADAGDGAFPL
ncbi:MAG: thiamine pyrophosphate-dependent enzyme [Planctomycetota bacterium]